MISGVCICFRVNQLWLSPGYPCRCIGLSRAPQHCKSFRPKARCGPDPQFSPPVAAPIDFFARISLPLDWPVLYATAPRVVSAEGTMLPRSAVLTAHCRARRCLRLHASLFRLLRTPTRRYDAMLPELWPFKRPSRARSNCQHALFELARQSGAAERLTSRRSDTLPPPEAQRRKAKIRIVGP